MGALGGVIAGYAIAGFWILFIVVYIVFIVVIIGAAAASGAYSSNY